MFRLFFSVALIMITFCSFGQGTIIFNKKYHWVNIYTKMPYLSVEEKDRMTMAWGKETDNKGENYKLTFTKDSSTYIIMEKEDNFGYSWEDGEDDLFIRDLKSKKTKDVRNLFGKNLLLEDDTPKYKWKILNELKDVAGYVCMKAETIDTVNNIPITAWFTDKLPISTGPEGFSGLPGMILALDYNTDDINIVATRVEVSTEKVRLPIPKKIKGKKMSYADYNAKKKKHIQLSITGRRNPYWEIRY
jgi:GLPGLI family protein